MGNLFKILSLILLAVGAVGLLGLFLGIGITNNLTTVGAVETVILIGLILQVLYRVTEGEL
jgi:hypothetical protein